MHLLELYQHYCKLLVKTLYYVLRFSIPKIRNISQKNLASFHLIIDGNSLEIVSVVFEKKPELLFFLCSDFWIKHFAKSI